MSTALADAPPLPLRRALALLARSVWRTVGLMARHEISQPTDHLDRVLSFADGCQSRVYRETVVNNAATDQPVVLIVEFRLRWVRGWAHRLFRAESLLNTPLFVGFDGFVSKLWVAHDEHAFYRGIYQWNEAALADAYVRALWWVLALVCRRGSIHHVVLPSLRLAEVLANPSVLEGVAPDEASAWWRVTDGG